MKTVKQYSLSLKTKSRESRKSLNLVSCKGIIGSCIDVVYMRSGHGFDSLLSSLFARITRSTT